MNTKIKTSIGYFEKPATFDEKEIAALIGKIVSTINVRDLNGLMSVFSESAQIVFSDNSQRLLTKSECMEYMAQMIENIRSLSYDNILIRVKNEEAVVSCRGCISFKGGNLKIISRYFTCQKEKRVWRIAKAEYF